MNEVGEGNTRLIFTRRDDHTNLLIATSLLDSNQLEHQCVKQNLFSLIWGNKRKRFILVRIFSLIGLWVPHLFKHFFFLCWIPNCSIPLGAHRPFVRNPITSLIAWPTSLVILLRGRLKTLTQKGLLAFEHPRAESLTSIILKQKQVLIQSLKSLSWKAKINKLIPTSQIITLRLTFHTFFNLDFMASTLNSFSLNSLPIKHYLFERL